MAIKAKEVKSGFTVLPAQISELVKKGFTEQQMSSIYEDKFKDTKAQALKLIEESDQVTLTVGEAIKTEYGSINLIETDRKSIDKDKLIKMVEDGEISIVDVLSCVSTFKNDDLEKTLGKRLFDTVATSSISKSFTWKISPDYKKECQDVMGDDVEVVRPVVPVAPPKPAKPAAVAKPTAAAKAAAVKSKLKSVDDILKGK